MDVLNRICILESIYKDGEIVAWQGRDRAGHPLAKVSVEEAARLRKQRSLVIIDDKRRLSGMAEEGQERPDTLLVLLRRAAKQEELEALILDGRLYRGRSDIEIVLRVKKAPPTRDNWCGFERAWSTNHVLTPTATKTGFRVLVVPRHPPDYQPSGVKTIDDLF